MSLWNPRGWANRHEKDYLGGDRVPSNATDLRTVGAAGPWDNDISGPRPLGAQTEEEYREAKTALVRVANRAWHKFLKERPMADKKPEIRMGPSKGKIQRVPTEKPKRRDDEYTVREKKIPASNMPVVKPKPLTKAERRKGSVPGMKDLKERTRA